MRLVEQEEFDDFAEEFTAASSGPSAETRGTTASESSAITQLGTGESVESTEAKPGDSSDGRERAYLKERNTVLSAKLEQREATIDELEGRIETLEAELASVRVSSASTTREQPSRDEAPDSSDDSLWDRAKRLVSGSHS